KDALTGTTDYAHLAELAVKVLDVPTVVRSPSPKPLAMSFAPLTRIRVAEPFEQLRDVSDKILAATGERPRIFLATLGSAADFNARATFAKNFFEAGGIEVTRDEGFKSVGDMVKAFTNSGAEIACLCSSDEVYLRDAAQAAKGLTDGGARHLYL